MNPYLEVGASLLTMGLGFAASKGLISTASVPVIVADVINTVPLIAATGMAVWAGWRHRRQGVITAVADLPNAAVIVPDIEKRLDFAAHPGVVTLNVSSIGAANAMNYSPTADVKTSK